MTVKNILFMVLAVAVTNLSAHNETLVLPSITYPIDAAVQQALSHIKQSEQHSFYALAIMTGLTSMFSGIFIYELFGPVKSVQGKQRPQPVNLTLDDQPPAYDSTMQMLKSIPLFRLRPEEEIADVPRTSLPSMLGKTIGLTMGGMFFCGITGGGWYLYYHRYVYTLKKIKACYLERKNWLITQDMQGVAVLDSIVKTHIHTIAYLHYLSQVIKKHTDAFARLAAQARIQTYLFVASLEQLKESAITPSLLADLQQQKDATVATMLDIINNTEPLLN